MSTHFFKAKSRLGLVNPPSGSTSLNIGVEEAPDAILDQGFLNYFKNYSIGEFEFTKPESIRPGNFFEVLAKELSDFTFFINQNIGLDDVQVVVGGDDSVTFSSLNAVLGRIEKPTEVGYIRFDSHADMNLYSQSPTKNFHGMYHRPFFDIFDKAEIEKLVKYKLNPNQVLFIGNLDLDSEEKVFFKKNRFRNINSYDISSNLSGVLREISNFIKSYRRLHISFDIDCLSKKDAPATGIPAKSALRFKDLIPILRLLSKRKLKSIDLVEVNPKLIGAEKTIKIAQEVLKILLCGGTGFAIYFADPHIIP